jgi:hypothetical protein
VSKLTVRRDYQIAVASFFDQRIYFGSWPGSSDPVPRRLNIRDLYPMPGSSPEPYVEGRFLLDEETVQQFFALFPADSRRPRRQVRYEYEVWRDNDGYTVSFSILATCSDAPETFTDNALWDLTNLIKDAEDRLDDHAQASLRRLSTTVTEQWRDINLATVEQLTEGALTWARVTQDLRPEFRERAMAAADKARERFIRELASAVSGNRRELGTQVTIALSRGHHWTLGQGTSARDAVEDAIETAGLPRPVLPDNMVELTDTALSLRSHDQSATLVAGQLLGPTRRQRRPVPRVIDTWAPPTLPVWGFGVLGLLVLAVGVSPIPLLLPALAVMPILSLLLLLTVIGVARRRGARLSPCLLGISAPVTIAFFAAVYGCLLLHGGGIKSSAGGRLHLVDPLLLAVGIATTDGTFDYLLHGYWARLAVLLEMLMLLTIAGTTAFTVARQALRSLQPTRSEPQ